MPAQHRRRLQIAAKHGDVHEIPLLGLDSLLRGNDSQFLSGLPFFNMYSMRSCVLGVFASATKFLRSRSSSHFSSTMLPGSTAPPQTTSAMREEMSSSWSETKPPAFM